MGGYLTEQKLENIIDVPVSLGATSLAMGDWILLGSVYVVQPMRLIYRLLDLQVLSSSVNVANLDSTNLIYGNLGIVYVVLVQNYTTGSPGSVTGLDTLVAYNVGHYDRDYTKPVFVTAPGVYSWLIANNTQPSTVANPSVPTSVSIDFEVAVTGSVRLQLDCA